MSDTNHQPRERILATCAAVVRIPSLRQQLQNVGPCPVCGLLYAPDVEEDRRYHRRFHGEYLRPRLPRPDPRLALYGWDIRVDAKSPRWLNALVFDRARALKRDEGYDFAQWSRDEPPPNAHAWLLVEQATAVGAVSFTWTVWDGADAPPPGWHMNFVWVADSWRRKGVLTRRWPGFRATYGDFTLEQPLSEAMEALVIKLGHPTRPGQL